MEIIAAFIAAFFIARLIGRVPFGETLICPQYRDVGGDPRLPTAVMESGRRAGFDTCDASNDAPRITHQGPEARAPVSMAGLGRWRVWWHGSEDEVPEIRPWRGFGSKTPHLKHFLPHFSDEETAGSPDYSCPDAFTGSGLPDFTASGSAAMSR